MNRLTARGKSILIVRYYFVRTRNQISGIFMRIWTTIRNAKTVSKRLLLLFLLGCLVVGCETEQPITEKKIDRGLETVSGLLKHFPENVQSSQAWHGHYYMVGDSPVIPTKEVPVEVLQRFVGSEVVVQGV